MMPVMISANVATPRMSGVMLRALMTSQPILSDTAAATSSTQNATKNAIALRRVIWAHFRSKGKGQGSKVRSKVRFTVRGQVKGSSQRSRSWPPEKHKGPPAGGPLTPYALACALDTRPNPLTFDLPSRHSLSSDDDSFVLLVGHVLRNFGSLDIPDQTEE